MNEILFRLRPHEVFIKQAPRWTEPQLKNKVCFNILPYNHRTCTRTAHEYKHAHELCSHACL